LTRLVGIFKSKNIIEVNQKQIEYLTKLNLKKDIEILKSKKTIDSLNMIKQEIKIIYRDKINKVKNLNANQLVNYWTNELK
jgi:hypothetical protein